MYSIVLCLAENKMKNSFFVHKQPVLLWKGKGKYGTMKRR